MKSSNLKRPFSLGFSLLEILVAMAIMAVMVGMTVPYIGQSSDKFAKEEIFRLLAAIEMVKDLAVIEDKEYGLVIDEEGYEFLILNDEDEVKPAVWEIISENKSLNKHEFEENIEVNISIDGNNIFQKKEDEIDIFEDDIDIFNKEEETEKVEPPQIYFLSTGEQNQFVIAIAASEDYQSDKDEPTFYRIKGNLAGELLYQGSLPGNIFSDIERDYSDYLNE